MKFGPVLLFTKMKNFCRNSPQKVHSNFPQELGRQIHANTFSALKSLVAGKVRCCFAQLPVIKTFVRFCRSRPDLAKGADID